MIGIALGASIWFVEDVPEPPIPVTFYASAPPPPPPPPAAPKAAPKPVQQQAKVVPVRPTEMTAPTIIPDKIPEAPSAPEPEGASGGSRAGSRAASKAACRAGCSEASSAGRDPGGGRAAAGRRRRQGARAVQKIEPSYPEAARKARMEGVVILEAIITVDGSVQDVKVLKSVNPLLDASAVRAVQQWKYKPATLNGRAVRVFLTVTVTFNLH